MALLTGDARTPTKVKQRSISLCHALLENRKLDSYEAQGQTGSCKDISIPLHFHYSYTQWKIYPITNLVEYSALLLVPQKIIVLLKMYFWIVALTSRLCHVQS